MIKVLETAVAKVKHLSEERQAYAAHVLEEIAADPTPFTVPDAHRATVLEGLAHAKRGEFTKDEDVEALLRRPWA